MIWGAPSPYCFWPNACQKAQAHTFRLQRPHLRFRDFDCPFKILNSLTGDIYPVALYATMK